MKICKSEQSMFLITAARSTTVETKDAAPSGCNSSESWFTAPSTTTKSRVGTKH